MAVFELVLSLLLGGVGLVLLSPVLGVPWPALLALAGTGLALVPGIPAVTLDPNLALALFVAPVLLDAGFDASPRDLRANWLPVGSLVLVAVALTVAAVAITAKWLVPDLPWPAAVALGAIVAPPDASAATAVLREVRLPNRIKIVLEGESLLNDASSLLIYRFAIGTVAGGLTLWTAPLLALSLVGGIVLGAVLARLYVTIAARVEESPAAVLLQFLGTFCVWLLAEALDLSAVLTIVSYAVTLARLVPGRTSARHRRSSYAVWEVTVFTLNVLAFILVGLQLRGIMTRLGGTLGPSIKFAATVLIVTILVRGLWVMVNMTLLRRSDSYMGHAVGQNRPNFRGGLVISWCGMRGIVTLAAALALPENFPHRDLILFTAFCVVLGTLVLQGLTLRPLLAAVALPGDDSVAEEVRLARRTCAQAALDALGVDRDNEAGRLMALHYEGLLAEEGNGRADATGLRSLRRRALAAERDSLIQMRHQGQIGDDAYHQVEEELDWAEAEGGPG